MKVCFVSKEIGGIRGGGIGVYVVEAGRALTALGHDTWLITEDPGPLKRSRLQALDAFNHILIAGENVPADRRARLFHGEPHYGYSMLVHETLQATGERFDYIEFPDYEAEGLIPIREQRLFGAYGDTALAVTLHSPTWECIVFDQQTHRASVAVREVSLLEDDAIRNAPLLASPSNGLFDLVTTRLGLDRPREIVRYPMRLSAELPDVPKPRASLEELSFLYFGRIEPRKGVENLVEAFRTLPTLRIRLVGADTPYSPYGGSLREYLERRAPANVEFVGEVPRSRMLELIQTADVCILPSLFENWPNACIEAMAAGRVVLGSRHGGMAEMIEHGTSGFIVDGRDSTDIARVISTDLAGALPRLDAIGRAAATRIRGFSSQQTYVDNVTRRVSAYRANRAPAAAVRASGTVSIVIPFYNDKDTIDEAVQSATRQTHTDVEILVIDDGSPLPDASEILSRQAASDRRVRVVRKKNGGLSSARNRGVAEATGDYVLFLDADNRLRPEYAATAASVLDRHPELVYVVPHAQFFEDGTGKDLGTYNPIPFDRSTALLINRFGDAGATFRRSAFAEHGLAYDEVLVAYEDWALWMDIVRKGLAGDVIPRVMYDYRVRPNSMVRQAGAPNHVALMGLLIERHFPVADPNERDVLVTLFQVAGQSVNQIMGGSPGPATPQQLGRWPAAAADAVMRVERVAGPFVRAAKESLARLRGHR